MTGGEFLYQAGFRTTRAFDVTQGHPGVPVSGVFNPILRTYGFTLTGKEIPAEQNAGAHARARGDGLRQSDAPFLLGLVAAAKNTPIVSDLAQDASDLSYLFGATQWVLDEALRLGLVAIEPQPPAPPVDPPAPPPAPPPVQPPPAGSGMSAPEQRVDELWAWIGQQWPVVRPVAVAALKMFRKAVGR